MSKANQKAKKQKKQDNTPKDILDKYATLIIRKDRVFERDGVSQVNTANPESYTPDKYSDDIVLWIPPKDCIRLEFEGTEEKNKRLIAEMESSCNGLNIQYCISHHKGGKSPYMNIFNIKGIPQNYDNKLAKEYLIERIMPSGGKEQLDKTNLGWTYSPVIGHQHWKKKYNGAKHEIIRGISPLDQINEYPKKLLKKIEKAKKYTKSTLFEIKQSNQWVEDFLVNYCTNHLLPKGQRHAVIEKNLASLILHRTDRDTILDRYLNTQERKTNTLRTWFSAIIDGRYVDISPLELKRYIDDYNIDYVIPKRKTVSSDIATDITPDKETIQILKDPKLLLKLVQEIQKQGVVGEENTILVLINKISLRLVKNHKPTSSNVVVSDLSSSGKDIITQTATKVMIPKDKLIHRTRFSDKALEYFMTDKPEDFTLDEYVIYLEDPEEDLLNSQSFRVMASGQNKVTVVKDQTLLELEIKGKPVIIVTSYQATIDEEGGRRWDALRTDTSEILTKKVIAEKLRRNAEGINWKKETSVTVKAIQQLKPQEVIIPYALKLLPSFEEKPSLIMRTQIDKLIDYIKASAVIHQHQREKDDKGRIIANDFDYIYGKFSFITLGDAEGGVLNRIEQDLIEVLRKAGKPLSLAETAGIKEFKRTKDWLYKHLDGLEAKGVIGEISEYDTDANKPIMKIYANFGYSSIALPMSSVLFGFISQKENQNKEGFIGFIGFINILKEINENRTKMGILPLNFEDLDEKFLQTSLKNSKNHKNHKNLSVKPIIKPKENQIKPTLKNHIEGLREYCEKIKQQGNKITYENLCYNFDESFISQCIESGLLKKLPKEDYEFFGG